MDFIYKCTMFMLVDSTSAVFWSAIENMCLVVIVQTEAIQETIVRTPSGNYTDKRFNCI